ncbi:immunity 17 family protein [Paenibacillus mesotrionivorans]|uniref:Immunity 17 family protein n=1 Tax=Paenibacillus mesotrionivorans TaxID=3160968 RepID=A0ACC7P567_9BACL
MENNTFAVIIGFGAGLFSIVASILNWDWFFNHRQARIFLKMFGRTGARVFYTILGLFLFFVAFKAMG